MKIIAEIGSNWITLDDCLMSIEQAKINGADIVKFQMFTAQELYGPNASAMSDLQSHELSPEWIPILKTKCENVGIEFMCTAFSVEGYKYIDPYVQRHKVASSEMVDYQILEYLNTTGKEVLLSTAGAHIINELKLALVKLRDVPVVIVHCVGDYPAKTYDALKLDEIYEAFGAGYKYGYSDHMLSMDPFTYILFSSASGMSHLEYYEKHVTFITTETPDTPHSLTGPEFSYFVKEIRGEDELSRPPCNKDMIKHYRRRLIATKDIDEGQMVQIGLNAAILRPVHPSEGHVPPLQAYLYLKNPLKRFIAQGDTIMMSDLGL